MKKHWYAAIEYLKLPIAMLIIGTIFNSLGMINTTSEILNTVISIFKYCGHIIIVLFPVSIVVCYAGKKYNDSVAGIGAVVSYILLHVVVMFMSNASLPNYFYTDLLGMSYQVSNEVVTLMLKPVNMGIVASLVVICLVSISYKFAQRRYNYGLLTFIDNEAWYLISLIILTLITAVGISFFIPPLAKIFVKGISFISRNSSNPVCMFLYGLIDKTLEVLNMQDITKSSFWFSSLGGNWINGGNVYSGDVNIWTAQLLNGEILAGTGKYITTRYINNIFVIPSLMIGYYINVNDKIEKGRMTGLLIVVIIVSALTGSSVPMEILLLFTAPLLLIIHIILSGSISMVCSILNISLGYSYTGVMENTSAGNLIDFVKYYFNVNLNETVIKLLIIGAIYFVLYQIIVFVYYRVLAQDFLDPEERRKEMKEVLGNLGGARNIKKITSSSHSLTVVVFDDSLVNLDEIIAGRAYSVTERYYGYKINYGPGSCRLCRDIKKEIADYNEIMNYKVGV